jgi:hypothetical protein
MSEALSQWETADLNRDHPETVQVATNTVQTTLREAPRGAAGFQWWQEQEREPGGIPEGGEFMSYPPGHRRLRRRRRRRFGGRRQRMKKSPSVRCSSADCDGGFAAP